MADKIVNPDEVDWSGKYKPPSKYAHLMDGQARELNIRDYDHTNVDNFRITLTAIARKNGLLSRSKKISDFKLIFQVIGKRDSR